MDLTEIPTDDLARELQRRYDVFFCVGVREPLGFGTEKEEHETGWAHGDSLKLLGLIERRKAQMLREILDDSRPSHDDE